MTDDVAIVGGGIAGLALALNLHRRGVPCRVYEAAPELKELGVGITLLPHAMRELAALGVADELATQAVEMRTSRFFNRFGQGIYAEPRGRGAGHPQPELGILRGRLHMMLYRAVVAALGTDAVMTDRQCIGVDAVGAEVVARFRRTSTGEPTEAVRAAFVVGCDGVHSAVRRQFYPGETMAFAGINSWRGVTPMPPIFDGHTYMRIGSIHGGKIVLYPIAALADGRQLINWVVNIQSDTRAMNDWNKPGRRADFMAHFADWRFDWLDVPAMIESAELLLEYPMCDKDPVATWTFGRVTLTGDAAHPMYPRGSNGAAQALIDVRVLAECLAADPSPDALREYERRRLPATSEIVRTNRSQPPDFINIKVAELTGDRPFENLDDFISQAELRALSERYQHIAGFARAGRG